MEVRRAVRDTPTAIERRVIAGLARLDAGERLERTMTLCQAATELAIAGIRIREGDLPDPDLRLRLARIRLTAAVVARVEAYRAGRSR
jgi:hypothetical protein